MTGFLNKLKNSFEKAAPLETVKEISSKNPLMPLVKKSVRADADLVEKTAAKLGFILTIIHSDGKIDESERQKLHSVIKQYLPLDDSQAKVLLEDLLRFNDMNLEMYYFAEPLNRLADENEKKEFAAELFSIAHADDEFDDFEEQDIRLVYKYLMLDHSDFISARKQAE